MRKQQKTNPVIYTIIGFFPSVHNLQNNPGQLKLSCEIVSTVLSWTKTILAWRKS